MSDDFLNQARTLNQGDTVRHQEGIRKGTRFNFSSKGSSVAGTNVEDWINPAYLRASTIRGARAVFASSRPLSHVQARNFLSEEKADIVRSWLNCADVEEVNIPNLHVYERMTSRKALAPFRSLKKWCLSNQCRTFLSLLTGLNVKVSDFFPIRFSHRQYTLLNDATNLKPGVDVFLDFSDDIPRNGGGELVYLTKTRELLKVFPCRNSLTIIPRPFGVMRYRKYVNYRVGRKKISQIWISGW